MSDRRRWATFAAAVVLMPTGGGLMVQAGLGVGPFDVLSTGVSAALGVAVGTAVGIIFLVASVLGALLGARPGIGTVVLVVAVPPLFEVARSIASEPATPGVQAAYLCGGLVVLYSGAALAVAAGLGAAPTEMVMVGLVGKGLPLVPVRWVMEAAMLVGGWSLGGQVGVGTPLTLVFGALIMRAVIGLATPGGYTLKRISRTSPSATS